MKISVIIPTYNRADTLKITLDKLLSQQGASFEVIVVDDGSTDHTKDVMKGFSDVRYIRQESSHQGVARNLGVKHAKGEIILFIGDDIFVEPGFLMKHLDRHMEYKEENVVVLGYTTWDPNIEINSYMRFLENSGWQFGYKFLNPKFIGKHDPYKFFYTSNISLKKSFFDKEKFNEEFKVYGWEDIELGYRLWKKHDMQIYYEPSAIGFHHHHIPEGDIVRKMNNVGFSAVHFQRLQPDVNVIPMGLKARIIKLASNPLTLPLFKILGKNTYYKVKSWHEFFNGVKKA